MRWLIRIAGGLLTCILVGVLYQFVGMARDRANYPPPGKLVDVGGYQLHLHCTGEGNPTVILDAMGTGWSIYWTRVQPELAKLTRVCSYDRAGFGWSDSGPLPRTGDRMAEELHQLLIRSGIDGPYILIGHSLGGFIMRLFREAHRNDVVGIVLVDAGHERQFEQEEFRKFVAPGAIMFPIIRAMTTIGLTRLLFSLDAIPSLFSKQEESVQPDIRLLLRMGWMQTRYFGTMDAEGTALRETCTQVIRAGSLGDLPLIVLTATGPIWWSDMPPDIDQAKFRKMWLELQADLPKLSANSRQLFADHSSHFMNFDQPDLIINSVRQMVETTRQKAAAQ